MFGYLIMIFKELLLLIPGIFRPFVIVLIVLSLIFLVIEIISSIWRLFGR